MANNWTRSAAHRHTTTPISALGLHPVARKLLLISRPAEGRRLSWPEHTYLHTLLLLYTSYTHIFTVDLKCSDVQIDVCVNYLPMCNRTNS